MVKRILVFMLLLVLFGTVFAFSESLFYEGKFLNTIDGGEKIVFLKTDGTKLYELGTDTDYIYQYSLSTAWDISTAVYDNKNFYVGLQEGTPTGIFVDESGTKLFIIGVNNDRVHQYSLSTAWDISTAVYDNKNFYVNSQEATPTDLLFKTDGTK